jgi:REP element-mobilizing transposase RayT
MAYWRLYYHLVWATHKRLALIDLARERVICATIIDKAKELGIELHGMGNVDDHIHVVVSIPPNLSIAECVQRFKGASSRAVNSTGPAEAEFKWQKGYGVISLGERSLATVVKYAQRQKEHHRTRNVNEYYERMEEEVDGPVMG